jgi:hypothetical protein
MISYRADLAGAIAELLQRSDAVIAPYELYVETDAGRERVNQ